MFARLDGYSINMPDCHPGEKHSEAIGSIHINSKYYVYIMTNKNNTVLYIGITNNIYRRVGEHISQLNNCFTSKYNIKKLVYYEGHMNIGAAIHREKQMKNLVRRKKIALIETMNPEWRDLFAEFS